MLNNNDPIGDELLNAPMGELIRSIVTSVVDAQFKMDKASMIMAEFMSGRHPLRDPDTGDLIDGDGKPSNTPAVIDSRIYFGHDIVGGKPIPRKVSLFELGFTPNFYQFVDTTIEVKLALRINKTRNSPSAGKNGSGRTMVTVTPVDAGYSSSYNFSAESASVFKTRLAPIPPPAILEERLRELLDQDASPPGTPEREEKQKEE
ncbi:MAG: hypothetical protein GY859_04580 [Desulfobacterales bacterium]|nr:hypothetical protein [Desulfobacterales bacterium]